VKIEPRQVEAFLKKPDPKIRGVVVYGNDDGLIAERAVALAKTVCEDLKDPFRVVDISGDMLKGDPARLADEFGAMSMLGGRRVIRVRPAGEESVAALENLAAAPAGDGLGVDPDALDWIVERLGGDRGQSRSEVDKLLLYKEGDGSKTIALGDALAVLGDTAAIGIDNVIAATFDGELVALDRALDRVFAEGGNPVQLVRALQRHADQLHLVAGHAAKDGNLEGAMFKARSLPRGGPVRQRFERHLRAWPLRRLGDALQAILKAEQDCKSTGYPDEAIARRLCLALASSARTVRQRQIVSS
jgi:DNA polymerase-3 subunit delta